MKFKDADQAVKELECYSYCLSISVKHFEKGNYLDAALYLENATRSLKALEELKVNNERNVSISIFFDSRDYDDHN